jgi:hypothetical protein
MSAPTAKRAPESSEYVVARGRTVYVDNKSVGPGQPVHLPKDEIAHLSKAGFIVPTDQEADSGQGVKVGVPHIRGGRKPGASIA